MSVLSVPVGTVIQYLADAQNEALPADYEYCQGQVLSPSQHNMPGLAGQNFTVPDLRNRFLIGADRTKTPGQTGGITNDVAGAPGVNTAFGLNTHALGITHLPLHGHTASSSGAVEFASHNHNWSQSASGAHTHVAAAWYVTSHNTGNNFKFRVSLGGDPATGPFGGRSDTGADANHAHTVYVSDNGAHAHNITVGNTGSGSSFDGRPRYFGIVYIMKVRV